MTKPKSEQAIPESEREPAGGAIETEPEVEEAAPEPWTAERVSEWNSYYDLYVVLAVLLLVFLASANKITHSSIWNQLQVGRQIAAQSAPVTTDPFSYTEEGKPWINIPWLFDWGQAAIYKVAYDLTQKDESDPIASAARADQVGAGTLVALTALARVLTAIFLLSIRRVGPGKWWTAICVTLALGAVLSPAGLVLGGIAGPAQVSPGAWGLLLFTIEVWLIFRATVRGSKGSAIALVPMFALWANVDESFLIGLFVLAAAALGTLVRRKGEEGGPEGVGPGVVFASLIGSTLACLLNPATFKVFAVAAQPILGVFRPATDVVTLDQLSYFGKGIGTQVGDAARSLQAFYLIFVGLGLGSFVLNRSRFSLSRFLMFALIATFWGVWIRFGAEFAIVAAASIALNGQEWYQDRFGTAGRLGMGWSLWSVGGRLLTLTVIFLFVGRQLLGGLPLRGLEANSLDPKFGFGFDPDDFMFEAADFLKTAPIKGNILNTTAAQGDAIVWRAFPERKTYVDGRPGLFPPEVRNELQEARRALSEDDKERWKPLLDKYQISVVIIQPETNGTDRGSPLTYRALSQSPNWVPFYDDGQVVMFGRTDAVDTDVAFFNSKKLDPGMAAYRRSQATMPVDRPPSPVTWIDRYFQTRTTARPQPHDDAARRWLAGSSDPDAPAQNLPDPARCLLAIREARTALASKPDDHQAFMILAGVYKLLMAQESALLAGLKLTPENANKIGQLNVRPDQLPIRFRQRVTALSYAIQTTPPPRTKAERIEYQSLNLELFQLFLSVNFIDLARDRLQAALDKSLPGDFTDEQKTRFSQDLAQLNERISQIQTSMGEMAVEQQSNPVAVAAFAAGQGAPGLAIHELEEAERTGANPALVKPRLIDLYCETGQPEKAIEMFSSGTVNDPSFGNEPGMPALRQARAYFLLGNSDYAATLIEKYATPALRYMRGTSSVSAAAGLIKGELKGASAAFLEIPEKIRQQSSWEYEAGLYRLEGGSPDLAAEHLTKALTLLPSMPARPIAAYYLEQIGKPVPPLTPATGEKSKPEEQSKAEEKKAEQPAKPNGEPRAEEKPKAEETKPGEKPKEDAPKPAEDPKKVEEPKKEGAK